MFYLVKTPWWMQRLYPSCTWNLKGPGKKVYLSFDDGPHPQITPFVLDLLKQYGAKASFFCIGKNVKAYPEIYKRIIDEGHAVGNHTQHHLNGWKNNLEDYLKDVEEAAGFINSRLFRPPYGKIKRQQISMLEKKPLNYKIVMWTVLSGDFDTGISKEKCLSNVLEKTSNGSIIVFHDSEKAFERMGYALPVVLNKLSENGYVFEKISEVIS